MSEAGPLPATKAMPDDDEGGTVLQALAEWRQQGTQHLDPVRFHQMEAMARRLPAQTGRVRRILARKLTAAMADHRATCQQAQTAAQAHVAMLAASHPDLVREGRKLYAAGDFRALHRLGVPVATGPGANLAALNRHIQDQAKAASPEPTPVHLANAPARPEMKSLQRFRETWSRISADNEVKKAIERGPDNAGPLNAHQLVLRSLTSMRDLSPDYLHRFLSQLDTLLWLDQVSQKPTAADAKPARRSPAKKQP